MIEIYTSNNPNENPVIVTARRLAGSTLNPSPMNGAARTNRLTGLQSPTQMERRFLAGEEEPDIDIHTEPTQ